MARTWVLPRELAGSPRRAAHLPRGAPGLRHAAGGAPEGAKGGGAGSGGCQSQVGRSPTWSASFEGGVVTRRRRGVRTAPALGKCECGVRPVGSLVGCWAVIGPRPAPGAVRGGRRRDARRRRARR